MRGFSLSRVNNTLEPPSPLAESRENPSESGGNPPDSSEAKQHVPPDPPIPTISSVEIPDSKPNPDNAESSESNQRRTIVGWFRTITKRVSHNRTADQMT